MINEELVRYLIRLTLSWMVMAITSIVVLLTLAFGALHLDDLYDLHKAEHAILLALPVVIPTR